MSGVKQSPTRGAAALIAAALLASALLGLIAPDRASAGQRIAWGGTSAWDWKWETTSLCAADDDGYLAESNADRLGKVSVGKSCIRFKRLEDLNLGVAVELSRRAAELVKEGRFAM